MKITIRGNEFHKLAQFFGKAEKAKEAVYNPAFAGSATTAESEYQAAYAEVKHLEQMLARKRGCLAVKRERRDIEESRYFNAKIHTDMKDFGITIGLRDGSSVKPTVFPITGRVAFDAGVEVFELRNPDVWSVDYMVRVIIELSASASIRTLADLRLLVEEAHTGYKALVWPEFVMGDKLLSEVVHDHLHTRNV